VITLRRDAVAKVVLNNLYKHTQLQTTFGANMLALVDGVPRTLRLDQFVRPLRRAPGRGHRPAHPLPAAQGRGARHILRALLKAIDQLDASSR
jgi:DNA gyrase subunit A